MTISDPSTRHADVVLVGAGIMSATLAVFLKELDPSLKIQLYEVLGSAAEESSNAWNNAGTGHAALCELNYTPQESDGSIDISKALQVNTEFDLSRQFWAYLVKKGAIKDPQAFIHPVPHFSFVRGPENRVFLRKRFEALSAHPLYYGMEYSEDAKEIEKRCAIRKDSQSTFLVECKICAVMGTCGVCESGTRKPDNTAMSKPNLFSSGQVADLCPSCKNPRFPRGEATAAFP